MSVETINHKGREITTGIVSVTFRKLATREIVDLAVKAGLSAIEWGGDIHVPHGDLDAARDARSITIDAGLKTACYGSYYRVGESGGGFTAVLKTALELGAPLIRVWAGGKGSSESTTSDRSAVVADLRQICAEAESEGIRIATEYHGGTLTDNLQSTVRLIDEVDHPNLHTLWQPNGPDNPTSRADEITVLAQHIANVHCFHWTADGRRPLAEGRAPWATYLQLLRQLDRPVAVLLEFVRDDDPVQFLIDASELKLWLAASQ